MYKVSKIIYVYVDGTYMTYVPSIFGNLPVSEYHATDYYKIIKYEDEMVQLEFDF